MQFTYSNENAAMSIKTSFLGRGHCGYQSANMNSSRGRRIYGRTKEEKTKLIYEHCKGTGHEMSECFKLHGYSNWYKKLKEQRSRPVANLT